MPIRNLVGGGATAREFSMANTTSNATIPLCPLIPPNLGRSERIDEDAREQSPISLCEIAVLSKRILDSTSWVI